jgi:hypothetical protein
MQFQRSYQVTVRPDRPVRTRPSDTGRQIRVRTRRSVGETRSQTGIERPDESILPSV